MWRMVGLLYATLALFSAGVAMLARDGDPLTHPSPWLSLSMGEAHGASLAGGLVLSLLVVASTRFSVRHFAWARLLHRELRPFARALGPFGVVALAVLSSLGEELFFRALLSPMIGVVLSSLLFGFLHQVRGEARWWWAGWASVVGLGLCCLFAATGSLVGPVVAHALINAINLRFLQDNEASPPPRKLGGLLGERPPQPSIQART